MSDDNKVAKMSPESRNQLVGLVNKTAEYVSEGFNPTDALAKAGLANSYPPDYIYRAAEAYNGAAHLHHFKKSNYEARGDSFDLADGKEALVQIMGSRPEEDKQADYVDMFGDDKRYFEALIPDGDKSASVDDPPSVTVKQATDNAERLRDIELRGIDKTREKLSEIVDALKHTLRRTRYQVSISDPVHINKVASDFLTYNDSDAVDIVTETTTMPYDEAVKLSSFDFGISRPEEDLYTLFDDCLLLKRAAMDTHHNLGIKEADHYCNDSERVELIYEILGIEKKATPGFDFDSVTVEDDDLNTLFSKEALFPGITLATGTAKKVLGADGGGEDTKLVDTDPQTQGLKSLLDPSFLQEIQKIELAKRMQQVLRDPVIAASAASPQEIQEALYELTAIAPSAVHYTPLLRSMLRRRLESKDRIDQFDISQILTTDQVLKNRAQQ